MVAINGSSHYRTEIPFALLPIYDVHLHIHAVTCSYCQVVKVLIHGEEMEENEQVITNVSVTMTKGVSSVCD